MGEFAKLDPLLHSELRLAIMSTLLTMEEADFVYLREATGATAGNLSVQIDKHDFASLYLPIPKPLPRKGLRSLLLRVLIPSTPSEGVKGAYHNGTKLREMLPLRQMDEEAMPFTGPVATVRR